MDAVLSIDTGSLTARVQPGVTRTRLNERAGQDGLFFPVDPGADASIGGMIATNASGTTTVRYGSMRQQILSLEVVLADGSVVRTGTLARKSSAGYDLTSLIVGSEGTLGIVTEAALLLQGIPEDTAVLRAQFPDTLSACNCAAGCMAMALSVSRMELMDRATIAMLNEYSDRDDPVEPSLLIEVEGTPSGVKEEIETIIEIAKDAGGASFEVISDHTARMELWNSRHNAAHAFTSRSAGRRVRGTDICVPISEMPNSVTLAEKSLRRHGFEGLTAGHVGDGNYHVVFMYDAEDKNQAERAEEMIAEMVTQALSVGGTCTGEHGIGMGKKHFLRDQHGELLPLMRSIKACFDPNGILNPDKIFDAS
jgi:D-lactate dehydrogenase (cytochrome)